MSICISETALRRSIAGVVLVLTALTFGFYLTQNRSGLIGGEIAFSKAVWLALAVLFWIILPGLILFDARTPRLLKTPFALLLGLMTARALIETSMLYVSNNWSPLYGIAHDFVCLAAIWGYCARACAAGAHRQAPTARCLAIHAIVTGLMFFPEIYYAWYMWAHFITQGGQAIYFVPDDGRHQVVLAVTASVDILLGAYLLWFIPAWLYGKALRARA